jgi:hypothetical protein
MKEQVESILEELYNDLSLSKEDKEELENSCNNFMLSELDKIKITLSKRVNEFCMEEVKKMKDKKMDRFNMNMNNMTINTCKFIADEFDLDEDEIIEQNKDNLLKINNYHEVYKQNYVETVIEEENKNTEEEDNEEEDNEEDNEEVNKKNPFEIKKSIVLDSKTENTDYKNFLITKKQCPAFIKGKYCCKIPKPGTNYCGYHKRFNDI